MDKYTIKDDSGSGTLWKPVFSLLRLQFGHITERIWLRAFCTPPKFLATLGTSDTLSR